MSGRLESDAGALIPARPTLASLRRAAASCHACPLWERGTQTVFGEGAADARLVLVGEQPGDREDQTGRPFVGPAGQLLDDALREAGIDRHAAYVTNAVKHFKWVPRGKRRIHEKPDRAELRACRPWLDAELALLHPRVLVLLGATAAQSLLGAAFRVTAERGKLLSGTGLAPAVMATVHPSSVLRSPTPEARHLARARFVEDLRHVAPLVC
ncbi:MAG TPA: UdgX family uracil-DNA binding protein [Myxococcales bacterium]|nr:UdgX family uracil-DNA binding protein [Myxococcales bacterium]